LRCGSPMLEIFLNSIRLYFWENLD
jgi:hypothetical protein